MTVLEMMIVLAIIGLAGMLVRSGFRAITKADLVEDATELSAVIHRASQLAIEHGELHRVTFDFDRDPNEKRDEARFDYVVEVCRGATAIQRNEAVRVDEETKKRALERGNERLRNMPPNALAPADPEEATRRATALAGHHVADRTCVPANDSINNSGDATGKGWARRLRKHGRDARNAWGGIHFKNIWVQHRDEPATKGQVALYFWPTGSAEKAVIELTDGDETFSIVVFGLSGRVELHDGTLRDVNQHMLKNVMGDKDAKREGQP